MRNRLTGLKMATLNHKIHERDGNRCIICGRYVDPGCKFHHEPCGINKKDQLAFGVLLCYDCHQERHFGKDSVKIKGQAELYLAKLYPEFWEAI